MQSRSSQGWFCTHLDWKCRRRAERDTGVPEGVVYRGGVCGGAGSCHLWSAAAVWSQVRSQHQPQQAEIQWWVDTLPSIHLSLLFLPPPTPWYIRDAALYIYITPIHLHENIIVSHNKVDHGIYIPVILTHSLTLFLSPLSSPSPLPLYFSLPSFFSLSLPPFIPYSAVKNRDGQKQWVQYS